MDNEVVYRYLNLAFDLPAKDTNVYISFEFSVRGKLCLSYDESKPVPPDDKLEYMMFHSSSLRIIGLVRRTGSLYLS